MKSTVIGQLEDSLRVVVCMYGAVVRCRNMRDALTRAGVGTPAFINCMGLADEQGALAFLVRGEILRRDKLRADARARWAGRKMTLPAQAD